MTSFSKAIIQDHPISNLPVYFVHPCMTHEAMRELCPIPNFQPIVYLLKWFGMFASVLGLTVPHDIAQQVEDLDRT